MHAVQAFSKLRGNFGSLELLKPKVCPEAAPMDVNCYTDGSLRRSVYHIFSLGGFGILHKNRDLEEEPLELNETQYAFNKVQGTDLHLYAPFPGPMCSSMRTELAAGLLALSRPGVVYMASDNKAYVCMVMNMLKGWRPSKPWSLTPNGDLWEIFYQHLHAKGLEAVSIKWVKAHTTAQQITQGLISLEDHEGNSISDILANLGADEHAKGLDALGRVYMFRRMLLGSLLCAIHKHIVRVFHKFISIEEKAKKIAWATTGRQDKVKPVLPTFECTNIPRNIRLRWPRADLFPGDGFLHYQIWHFLRGIQIGPRVPRADGIGQYHQGFSWLELLCLFEIRGGMLQREDLSTRLSLRACLIKFRSNVLRVVDTCMFHEDAILFRPTKCPIIRLRPLGFTNFAPCINGMVVPREDEKNKLLIALVQLKANLTKAMRNSVLQGTFEVTPNRLSLRGAPAWRKGLQVSSMLPCISVQNQQPADCNVRQSNAEGFSLFCPTCGIAKLVANVSLHHGGKWARLKCTTCCVSCTARNWRCSCGAAWFSCPIHAQTGFACRAIKRVQFARRSIKRRPETTTNNAAPPTVDDGATLFPAAKRQHVNSFWERKRAATVIASSGDNSTGHTTGNVAAGGTKRCSDVHAPKKKAKAKAKSYSNSSESVAAIERMREARANPC